MRDGASSGPRKTMPICGGLPASFGSPVERLSVQSLSIDMVLRSMAALPLARASAVSSARFWRRTVPAAMATLPSISVKGRTSASMKRSKSSRRAPSVYSWPRSAEEGAVDALLCRDELSVEAVLVVLDEPLPLLTCQLVRSEPNPNTTLRERP